MLWAPPPCPDPPMTATRDFQPAAQVSPPTVLPLDLGICRSELSLFEPTGETRARALLVPALGVAARSYARLGQALRARGVALAVVELRGNGASSVRAARGVDWGYLDLLDGELQTAMQTLQQRWAGQPLSLIGHSMGGHLALLHQARHPQQAVQRVALIASGSPWYRNYPWWGRGLLRGFAAWSRASSRRLGVFRGDWVGFGGRQGARLMHEWGEFCRDGRLPALGAEGWDAHAAMTGLRRDKTGIVMAGDHYAPPASTEHLASLIDGPTRLQRVERLADGRKPGHFGWMRAPDSVLDPLLQAIAPG